jgi:hypothetical protein
MPKIDFGLFFSENSYAIFDNQAIQILEATDATDKSFHLQLRCMKDKSEKIDFNKLKEYLKNNTEILSNGKRVLHYPDYKPAKMDKTARANEIFNLFPGIQHAEFIYNKVLFRKDGEEIKDKNIINFFKIFSYQTNTKNTQFGYEIPDTYTENVIPNCCIYSIDSKKTLSNKIYLFPYGPTSIQNLANEKALKEFPDNAQELKILHFEGDTHPDRDIYLELLLNMGEILQHLEKPKIFGNDATDKIEIFLELSKMISNKESLQNIKDFLNRHDKVKILSKHRDPWGFFAFFKGETYSAFMWKELGKMLRNPDQTETPLPRPSR